MGMDNTIPRMIRLYTMGEDQAHLYICRSILQSKAPISLLGTLIGHKIGALKEVLANIKPDVALMNIKNLKGDTIKELEEIRTEYPEMGFVLLLEVCNAQDIEQLRRLALLKGMGGTAIFLKKPQDSMDWLFTAISAVNNGRFIIDGPLAAFMFAGKPGIAFLKQFTPRELEILTLLANGYTNSGIATALYIDVKTVEHHLNNMYTKLKENYKFSDRHLRVSVAKLYLEAIGESGREKSLISHGLNNQ